MRSSPLGRLCFLANDFLLSLTLLVILLNTSSTRRAWLVLSLFSLVGVWWFWWEALYLPLLYIDTSSILRRCAYWCPLLCALGFLVTDISPSWALADGCSSAGRTGLGSAVLDGVIIGVGLLRRHSFTSVG